MTPKAFLELVMQAVVKGSIADTISIGGAYELQLRNFAAIYLLTYYRTVAVEVNYPESLEKIDLAFYLDGTLHGIEIKVESPTNAGHFSHHKSLLSAHTADTMKLAKFTGAPHYANPTKWFLVAMYSGEAKEQLAEMQLTHPLLIDSEGSITVGLFY